MFDYGYSTSFLVGLAAVVILVLTAYIWIPRLPLIGRVLYWTAIVLGLVVVVLLVPIRYLASAIIGFGGIMIFAVLIDIVPDVWERWQSEGDDKMSFLDRARAVFMFLLMALIGIALISVSIDVFSIDG